MKKLKSWLRFLAMAPVVVLLLFEEWGWEPLAALFAKLARLPLWGWMERKVSQLPPWGALLVFGVPMLTLLPVKLGALYLFGHGHAGWGLGLLIGAKLLGTAVMARLFHLTQPALMQLSWFARWYPRWKSWKDTVLQKVRASAAWQWGHATRQRVAQWWKGVRILPRD
jgi:hypothetical protein